MPTMTIYIRTEDLDKWTSIDNKSEFVHRALKDLVTSQIQAGIDEFNKETGKHAKLVGEVQVSPIKQKALKEAITSSIDSKMTEPVTYKKTNSWGA